MISASLPVGYVGQDYTAGVLLANDQDGQITKFEILSSELPATNLGLAPRGVDQYTVSGVPSKAGTYWITAKATDNSGLSTTGKFFVQILDKGAPVQPPRPNPKNLPPVILGTLNNGIVGQAYKSELGVYDVDGYIKNVTIVDESLPNGVTLSYNNSRITLGGTPTEAGTFKVKVRATDDKGATTEGTYTFVVTDKKLSDNNLPPEFTGVYPDGVVNTEYNNSVYANDRDGFVAKVEVISQTLPEGLTATVKDRRVMITGTPKATGTATIELKATDDKGAATTQRYSFVVRDSGTITPPDEIPINTPPRIVGNPESGVVDMPYTTVIKTSDADEGDYVDTVTVKDSTLAETNLETMIVGDNVYVTGTPTKEGVYKFTVTATDSRGATTEKTFSVLVFDKTVIQPTPSNRPPVLIGDFKDDMVGNNYADAIGARDLDPDGKVVKLVVEVPNNGTDGESRTVEAGKVVNDAIKLLNPDGSDSGLTAYLNLGGVSVNGVPKQTGKYTLHVTAIDDKGAETSKVYTFNITARDVSRIAAHDVYIEVGGQYDPVSMVDIAEDYDGTVVNTSRITKDTSKVTVDTVGDYPVTFTFENGLGKSVTTTAYVHVRAKNTPVPAIPSHTSQKPDGSVVFVNQYLPLKPEVAITGVLAKNGITITHREVISPMPNTDTPGYTTPVEVRTTFTYVDKDGKKQSATEDVTVKVFVVEKGANGADGKSVATSNGDLIETDLRHQTISSGGTIKPVTVTVFDKDTKVTYGYLDKEGVAHDNALPDGLKATEVTDPGSSTKKLLVTGTLSDPGIYYIYANATGKKLTEGAVETSYTEKEYAVISVVSQEASDNSTKPLSVETVKELGVTTINFYYDEDGNGTRNGTEKIVSTATVRDGADGKPITITNTETLTSGDTRIVFSDGHEVIVPKGAKGDKGETGEAIRAWQAVAREHVVSAAVEHFHLTAQATACHALMASPAIIPTSAT